MADLRGDSQFGKTEADARGKGNVTGAGFARARDEVLVSLRGAFEGDDISFATSEFDHDDRV